MRMRFLLAAIVCAAMTAGSAPANAQTYPNAPVKMIVTTGAGGAPDVIARIVAEGLSRHWGQQVFVTNHPGAAGSIGMKVAGTSPPTATRCCTRCRRASSRCRRSPRAFPTIWCATSCRSASSASSRWRSRCRPSLGINTLGEFIDYVKKRPGAGQRRGAEPRRHSASARGMDQDRGQARHDLDQLSRHAGGPDRRHGRPRAGDHGRSAESGRRDPGRPAQADRGRLGAAAAEHARTSPTIAETLPGIKRALGWFALMAPPGTPEPIAQQDQRRSAHGARASRR